jgi:transcriptional regulator with XRE-family HTH domain
MSELPGHGLRRHRELAGLTQADLAARAGVSRQLVGAVEAGRHLPRVDAAVALAGVLGVEVVELFGTVARVVDVVSGDEPGDGASLRLGWVGDRLVSTPARIGADGWDVADGVVEGHSLKRLDDIRAGVVVAGCEPALETVERLMRQGGLGGVAVPASSAVALEAVVGGRAHAAVVHGPRDALPAAPPGVARFLLAGWRVGLALPDGIGGSWWSRVVSGELAVVQREAGAAVQRSFEEATGLSPVPGRRVGGHVVAARTGLAAGLPAVTIEPAARAVGSAFHSLGDHAAELWVGEQWLGERGVEEMIALVGSSRLRRILEAVGGYRVEGMGRRVA